MSRDPEKLRVFQRADALVEIVYESTRRFPAEERFGLTAQLRRGAVSICTNIVEGSSRRTERDYVRFLELARGSACELRYLLGLAARLKFLNEQQASKVGGEADHVCRALYALIESLGRDRLSRQSPLASPSRA